MWSVRPFNPRCAAVLGERAAEAMAARLGAAADRCATALRVGLKRFCGWLAAVVARTAGVTDWATRPLWIGCRYDGCPNDEKRGPAPPKFATPPEPRAPPKPTPPPRLPTPKLPRPALKPPPPRKPPPWKPPPPPKCPPPPKPPPCPPPPPPWPAAHPALVRAIDVMPTKLSNFNFFIFQHRDSSVSRPLRIRGIL